MGADDHDNIQKLSLFLSRYHPVVLSCPGSSCPQAPYTANHFKKHIPINGQKQHRSAGGFHNDFYRENKTNDHHCVIQQIKENIICHLLFGEQICQSRIGILHNDLGVQRPGEITCLLQNTHQCKSRQRQYRRQDLTLTEDQVKHIKARHNRKIDAEQSRIDQKLRQNPEIPPS